MQKKQIGVLITNVGSPDSPEEQAVRRYLAEFLADPKVIDYPRWFWLPLLNQIILKSRPARSAKLYQNIWQPAGSPLLLTMDKIAQKLQEALNQSALQEYHVEIGMRYGNPSLQHGIRTLLKKPLDELILLPLFPQYSITTTGTTLEAAIQALNQAENAPFIRTIGSYHDNPAYIAALASSIKNPAASKTPGTQMENLSGTCSLSTGSLNAIKNLMTTETNACKLDLWSPKNWAWRLMNGNLLSNPGLALSHGCNLILTKPSIIGETAACKASACWHPDFLWTAWKPPTSLAGKPGTFSNQLEGNISTIFQR